MVPPHPSGILSQFLPSAAQVVGVQSQTLGWPLPPQILGAWQVPQVTSLPQPSEIWPQVNPIFSQVMALHVPVPQRLGPAAPQVWPAAQSPQFSTPPQLSGSMPQFLPSASQVVGTQPQVLGAPAPPQVSGAWQPPQFKSWPQPSAR